MATFLLLESFVGKGGGTGKVVATGSRVQSVACVPDGYVERKLAAEEHMWLEMGIITGYLLLEVTSPGRAEVLSSSLFVKAEPITRDDITTDDD